MTAEGKMQVPSVSLCRTNRDQRMELPRFLLTKTFRPAGLRIPKHVHEFTNIGLCTEGTFRETVSAKWREISSATLICRPAGEPHANCYGPLPVQCLIFEVPSTTLASFRELSPILERTVCLQSETVQFMAMRMDRELQIGDCFTALSLESLVYELIIHASRNLLDRSGPAPQWLSRVRELFHDGFNSSLRLCDIADAVQVHPARLSKMFREYFHMTPGEYVRELRVLHGARLLASDMPLAEIALVSGFCDQSHFSRAFKRRFGSTPARYQASLSRSERYRESTT